MMLQIFLHIILVRFIFWMIIDHPEYESNENDVKKLLKEIDETGEVARKVLDCLSLYASMRTIN